MKKLLLLVIIALSTQTIKAQADAFITTWVTTTGFETITLETQPEAPNYTINWGDGFTNTYTATQVPTHTYFNSGEHTVSFTGTFPHLTFGGQTKLKAVQQWGTQKWTSMAYMFFGCFTFNSFPTQAPDLSLCTDMGSMFYRADAFNQPIGSWNVSNVTNMFRMFEDASAFNQPLESWDVSNVTDMSYMFTYASAFNQNIGSWNVSKVTDMGYMFYSASAYNQPIGTWNVSQVTYMGSMFYDATAFNQPIGSWDVSQVTNMKFMFGYAFAFNQPIGSWNVSKVTDMGTMFADASAFNQPIDSWDVSNVTQMGGMFYYATAFNQPIEAWDVGKVTYMNAMFGYAFAFNQPIGSWNVSKVTDMVRMFVDSGLSTANYDATLIGWSTRGANGGVLKSGVTFSGGSSNYCNGLGARNFLINTYKWVITDGGANCASLATEAFDKSSVSLYPNPALSVLNIKTNENLANQTYAITDALGKIVLKGKLNEGDNSFNVEHLSKGIYYLKVSDKNASKIIKE